MGAKTFYTANGAAAVQADSAEPYSMTLEFSTGAAKVDETPTVNDSALDFAVSAYFTVMAATLMLLN